MPCILIYVVVCMKHNSTK